MRRLILWLYDQLYTRLAWSYDLATGLGSGGLWYEWAYVAERYVRAGPVLEVGCGRGRLLARLAGQGYQVAGLDRSPQMARAARNRSRRAGADGPLIQAMGQGLPFPDASFTTVITTFPSPYIYDPLTQREIGRVLRPGGHWLWVDVIFARRFTLRILPVATLTHLAGFRRSTLGRGKCGRLDGVLGIVGLSRHKPAWQPRIAAAHLFDVTVAQVPVKATGVHVAVLRKVGGDDTA